MTVKIDQNVLLGDISLVVESLRLV